MGTLLSYSINVAIFLLPMYLIYKWLLAHETFHRFNRMVILLSYAVALLAAPIMNIVERLSVEAVVTQGSFDINSLMGNAHVVNGNLASIWVMVLLAVYLLGCMVMTIRTLCVWTKIARVIIGGEKQSQGDCTLVITDNSLIAPFSWMRYVVMSRGDYSQAGEMILTHEKQHLRCRHWVDLLIAEFVIILNWFNPAAWLLKEELKTVHEYQADEAVLQSGVDARNYQLLLIKKAVGARFPSLANSLNHSKLKKRITMMLSNHSRKSSRLRALAIVPVVATALLVVNQPSVAGTLSAISSSELSLPDNDKGNEKTVIKSTIKINGDSSDFKIDGLKGVPTKYFLDGKEITKEQLKNIDQSKVVNMNVNKSNDEVIVEISTKGTVEAKAIENVVVIGKGTGTLDKKGIENVDFYVNGEKVQEDELNKISADKIKHMKVNKTDDNGITTIEILVEK
ncbi:MAG: M56 family metallopeptidase [Muribaculaceae bacterium]|nr:M56 family metallopeptidase [Muribaculaceae bacterium]